MRTCPKHCSTERRSCSCLLRLRAPDLAASGQVNRQRADFLDEDGTRTPPGAGESSALASNSDLVVVSHGTEAPHPLFNFGTQGALDLWEVDWPTFVAMESRASAEEDERAERERLLALVREQGYVDGYTGVRASSTGQRFRVHDALVWNVQNEDGERLGQAAMFRRAEVEFL